LDELQPGRTDQRNIRPADRSVLLAQSCADLGYRGGEPIDLLHRRFAGEAIDQRLRGPLAQSFATPSGVMGRLNWEVIAGGLADVPVVRAEAGSGARARCLS
jgi:hypothetical protein